MESDALSGEQALTDGQGHVDTAQTASADDRARFVAHERLFKDDIRPFFGFHGKHFVEWKQKFGAFNVRGLPPTFSTRRPSCAFAQSVEHFVAASEVLAMIVLNAVIKNSCVWVGQL